MKKIFLLPHRFKLPGLLIMIPATVIGLMIMFNEFQISALDTHVFAMYAQDLGADRYFTMVPDNITNELIGLLFIIGALMLGFSKEKTEDEYIASVRLSSLLWAVYVNYALLIICFLFVYGISFLQVITFNIFTVLIIFIARFNFIIYRNKKRFADEK